MNIANIGEGQSMINVQSVDWREITGGEQFGIVVRSPCVNPENACKCDKHEFPTQEEIEAEEKAIQEAMDQFTRELPFWDKLKQENKRGSQGVCKCPRCSQDCHWSIASLNGHLWVRCSTENCVAFME